MQIYGQTDTKRNKIRTKRGQKKDEKGEKMNRKEGDYKKKRRKDKTEIGKERTKKRVTQVEKVEDILKEKAMQLSYKRNDITPQKQCHCSVISS